MVLYGDEYDGNAKTSGLSVSSSPPVKTSSPTVMIATLASLRARLKCLYDEDDGDGVGLLVNILIFTITRLHIPALIEHVVCMIWPI